MTTVSDKAVAIARVYGNAMLESAEAIGEGDFLLGELSELNSRLDEDAAFERFFVSPMIDVAARKQSIEKIFRGRVSDLLTDSLQVLNRKERLDLIRAVIEQYRLAHAEARGRIDVHVQTAIPLTEAARSRIREAATSYAGKEAELVETVDESILGGMVIKVGDRKFDTSLASRLKRVSGLLRERASRELYAGKTFTG